MLMVADGSWRSWPTRAKTPTRSGTSSPARAEAVITPKANRRDPVPHDRQKYRWRNQIERLFNKLKN